MQSALLASEEQRRELETGIGLIQTALHNASRTGRKPKRNSPA
ncbi:MAG: DUF5930 domain-containing protein [Paracoccaceae bacterium]